MQIQNITKMVNPGKFNQFYAVLNTAKTPSMQ